MTVWRTFALRVLQASWGIAIDLRARAVFDDVLPPESLLVGNRVALDLTDVQLGAEEVEQLQRGLRLMTPAIELAHPDGKILIKIGEVGFTPTDYQPEGLAAAMIGWASEEFQLDPVPWDFKFDASTNRYVFRI
jgi:hypothetical protein